MNEKTPTEILWRINERRSRKAIVHLDREAQSLKASRIPEEQSDGEELETLIGELSQ